MKNSRRAQSATSLPRAPRDDVGARSHRYLAMMGVRILCFILMVVITPYGWYTWLFGAAAIFLPYIAVVSANVGQEARRNRREDPKPALTSTAPSVEGPREAHPVIRLDETRSDSDSRVADGPDAGRPTAPPRSDPDGAP